MALKLFYMSISPPSRAVLLTARNLGLDVDVKHVNLLAGEHLTAEFLKMSPVHQVPVLVDNDFVLCESRAIMTYLVNSKRPGSELYPTDPKQRAQIDRLLYYDATIVFERNGSVIRHVYMQDNPTVSVDQKNLISEYMNILNSFLKKSLWFAGDKPTLADLSILPNISQITACGYSLNQHENLVKWFGRCRELPGYEENQMNALEVGNFFKSKIPNAFST